MAEGFGRGEEETDCSGRGRNRRLEVADASEIWGGERGIWVRVARELARVARDLEFVTLF
jgi:hypothetical protein